MCAAVTPTTSRSAPALPVRGVLVTGAALAGAAGYLAVVDPTDAGWLPGCPFHTLTGWWCPGCGLTRATHHLLRGDVPAALSHHLFVPLVLLAIAVGWLSTLRVSLGRPAVTWPRRIPTAVWAVTAVAVAVFSVARNTATFSALAP